MLTSAARKPKLRAGRKIALRSSRSRNGGSFRCAISAEIGHFEESSATLLIDEPIARRKIPKIARSCQRIRFKDNSISFTEFKLYQIKSAGIKCVKEYQSTAETINVAAKCIRKYLEQWPKAREN